MLPQKHYLGLFIWKELSKLSFRSLNTECLPEAQVGRRPGRESPLEAESWGGGLLKYLWGILENGNLLLVLQIGNLDDYYHFYHSKTFKRSTLSSRGPHTFLRMDPQVHASRQGSFLSIQASSEWTIMGFYSQKLISVFTLDKRQQR